MTWDEGRVLMGGVVHGYDLGSWLQLPIFCLLAWLQYRVFYMVENGNLLFHIFLKYNYFLIWLELKMQQSMEYAYIS